ncbi:MAG: hypothetical protein AABW56_00195 [Nanoarchaeota archaeon]
MKMLNKVLLTTALFGSLNYAIAGGENSENVDTEGNLHLSLKFFGLSFYNSIGEITNLDEYIKSLKFKMDENSLELNLKQESLGKLNISDVDILSLAVYYKTGDFQFDFGLMGFSYLSVNVSEHKYHTNDARYFNSEGRKIIPYYKLRTNVDSHGYDDLSIKEFTKSIEGILRPYVEVGYYFNKDFKIFIGFDPKEYIGKEIYLEQGYLYDNKHLAISKVNIGKIKFYNLYSGISLSDRKKSDFRLTLIAGVSKINYSPDQQFIGTQKYFKKNVPFIGFKFEMPLL